MHSFDSSIMSFLNQFSQQSHLFDNWVVFLAANHLIKGGVLITILWWLWFEDKEPHSRNRNHIVSTLFGCIIAMILARGLALTLPFRHRPLHEESLSMLFPFGVESTYLEGWSSFPSDHAVLFYTLSTGLFFISKKVGAFALLYTTLFIGLPRIYLGLHYPSDILGGAILGIITATIFNSTALTKKLSSSILNWSDANPQFFYPIFFLITYQIADMFSHSRDMIGIIASLLKAFIL